MSSVELRKLKTILPGQSTGGLERRSDLGLGKLDIQKQSVQINNVDHIHITTVTTDAKPIDVYYDDVRTLYDGFRRGLKLGESAPCLGWRPGPDQPYKWLSYEQVHRRTQFFGSGLINKGFPAGQETFIGIYSSNRIGWVIAEQAANMYSMVIVPLYDTLGPDACKFICNQAELKVVVCDTEKRGSLLLDAADGIPSLNTIILMDKPSDEFVEKAKQKGITVHKFTEIERVGENDLQDPVPPKPEDLCTICYTSGTTGNPKGAMITHGSFISAASGQYAVMADSFETRTGEVYISYLPLAHVYERFAQLNMFMHGARVGFFQGDPKLLLDDLQALRPTFFPCVPRVMNKIYDKVLAAVNEAGGLKKKLFDRALKAKKREIQKGIIRNNGPLWDKILKKARNLTGGRVRIITSGAAPISPEIKMFFRAIFGCLVIEGYGQTETSTLTSITNPRDLSDGHVGCIIGCVQVKLIDVPDLEYFAADGQGEVCVKGGNVFKGYFKDPEKTRETIDEDGWLHSGDIGEFLPGGQLKIIDRVKHIFKLSQGEYVAPEKIENEYLRTEGVAQIFIHGDSLQDACVGLAIPDEEWLEKLAKKNGWDGGPADWCEKKELNDLISAKLKATAKLAQLKGFEQVRIIKVHPELFSIENGLLTPTFKAKRPVVKKRFAEVFASLYQELAERKRLAEEARVTEERKAEDNRAAANAATNGSVAAANGPVQEAAANDAAKGDGRKDAAEENGNEVVEEEGEGKQGAKEEISGGASGSEGLGEEIGDTPDDGEGKTDGDGKGDEAGKEGQ